MAKKDLSNKTIAQWLVVSAVMIGIIYTAFFLLLLFNQKNITLPAPPDSATYLTPTPTKEPIVTVTPTDEPAMCSMIALKCPDGSYVSRTGPNCAFAPCPTKK